MNSIGRLLDALNGEAIRDAVRALGAGLLTSPIGSTAGLPCRARCRRHWESFGRVVVLGRTPRLASLGDLQSGDGAGSETRAQRGHWETFGRKAVRGRRPAHSAVVRGRRPAHSARRPAHSANTRRRGFTLVEMLVVMTVFTFLLASVALAIGTLFRAQGQLQDELAQAHTMSRLAAQLRADAHLANSAGGRPAVKPNGEVRRPAPSAVRPNGEVRRPASSITGVWLRLPNATIRYETHPRRIIRTVMQDEAVVHREVYSLLEGTTADWDISAATPPFITLATSYRSPELRAGVARSRDYRIEASIGLHAGGVQ